jgi:hypothetical protein
MVLFQSRSCSWPTEPGRRRARRSLCGLVRRGHHPGHHEGMPPTRLAGRSGPGRRDTGSCGQPPALPTAGPSPRSYRWGCCGGSSAMPPRAGAKPACRCMPDPFCIPSTARHQPGQALLQRPEHAMAAGRSRSVQLRLHMHIWAGIVADVLTPRMRSTSGSVVDPCTRDIR